MANPVESPATHSAQPVVLHLNRSAPAAASDTPEPESPTSGEKHLELAVKHDFAAKFKHPALLDQVKQYVLAQAEHRRFTLGAENPARLELPDVAPVSINLDLTTACNYACDHCVDMDILNQPIRYEHEKLMESLESMAARGLRSVIIIGGGEPTLYRYFDETVRLLKRLSIQVAIVSNGSRQYKVAEIADCLDENDWVRLSLDAGLDSTFQAMHKPKKQKITLEEICEAVYGIKQLNNRFQFGFSFIITWKGAAINDTHIVENLDEIVPAAELARRSGFDYISFKPFLTRAPENNAEIVDLDDTDVSFERIMSRIRGHLDKAKKLNTDTFKVIESTSLRVLENRAHRDYLVQPRQCHMQFFRQILSPLGVYNCPVYRNQPHGRVNDKGGYAGPDRSAESLANTATLIQKFDATYQCREVTCLYNHVNWWLEDLIRHPEKLSALEPTAGRDPDFFF